MNKDLCYPFIAKVRTTQVFNVKNPPTNQPHGGIDFGTVDLKKDKSIFSAFDGVVIYASDTKGGLAIAVYNAKENVTEVFWHIGSRKARNGATVKRGDILGSTGKSGIYAEHTHVQFNKGRSVRGTMQPETLNPNSFFDRMKLISEFNVVVNPIKPKVGTLLKWNAKVNLRDKPTTAGKDVGEVAISEQQITQSESVIADGYEWIGVKKGFAVIQDMKTGEKFVSEIAPPEDPKDKEIRELHEEKARLERDVDSLKGLVTDKNTAITALETSLNSEQQLKGKILSDMHKVSKLLSVQYDPAQEWSAEGEAVGQHYKFEGAIATMKTEAVSKATSVELLTALVTKLIKKRNV